MELIDKNANPPASESGRKPDPAKDSTDMAVERTLMAADRSLMAWVRTGLSLISFGFTIYKFMEYQQEQLQAAGRGIIIYSSPQLLGLFMIGIGVLSLVFGTIENLTVVKSYRTRYGITRPKYSLIIAGIILIIGIFLFVGILFKIKGIV
jgi:putative membrane protein